MVLFVPDGAVNSSSFGDIGTVAASSHNGAAVLLTRVQRLLRLPKSDYRGASSMICKVILFSLILILLILFVCIVWLLQEQEALHRRGLALYDQLPPRCQSFLFRLFYEAVQQSQFVPRRALMLLKVAHLILPWSEVHRLICHFIGLEASSLSNRDVVLKRLNTLCWRPGGRPLMVWLRSFYLFGRLSGEPSDADLIAEGRRWD